MMLGPILILLVNLFTPSRGIRDGIIVVGIVVALTGVAAVGVTRRMP